MNKNRIWALLLGMVSLGALVFTTKGFCELYQFLSLKNSTPAYVLEPHIQKLTSGKYLLNVRFDYEVQGHRFSREQKISTSPYKNRLVALETFTKFQKTLPVVWYHEKHPEKGVLNKAFPFKRIFSATLLVAILVYFYLLGRYVLKLE